MLPLAGRHSHDHSWARGLDDATRTLIMQELDVSGDGMVSYSEALIGILRLRDDVVIRKAFGFDRMQGGGGGGGGGGAGGGLQAATAGSRRFTRARMRAPSIASVASRRSTASSIFSNAGLHAANHDARLQQC